MGAQFRSRVKGLRRVVASALKPSPHNWRRHGDGQRSALRALLEEIGFAGACLARELDDGTLELIDGHLRADELSAEKVPVLVTDLTEEEAKVVVATYDPLGQLADDDCEALQELLESIESESDGINALLQDLAADKSIDLAALCDEDDDDWEVPTPEPPDEATTRTGDLWFLGEHRLLCGDSATAADVDRLLDGAKVHLVNTDPPYNVKVEPRSNNAIAAGLSSFGGAKHHQSLDVARHPGKAKPTSKKLRAKDRPLANDYVSDAEFERLLAAWFGNVARVLGPGRSFYIWGGYANCANYPPVLKASGLYFSQSLIWVKEHPVLTRKDFMGNHEWCFYGWREGGPHRFLGPNNVADTWSVKKVNPQSMVHLTEKPVELAVRAMQYSTRAKEHVLDLFGGSGSTLMAAEQVGRRAYLMELDPLYCDVIVERWQQLAGRKAKRAPRGRKRT